MEKVKCHRDRRFRFLMEMGITLFSILGRPNAIFKSVKDHYLGYPNTQVHHRC